LSIGILSGVLSPRDSYARSGNTDLETIGITTAIGTVIGASTLSFADQPGTHLLNIAVGAALGAVSGVIYVLARDPEPQSTLNGQLREMREASLKNSLGPSSLLGTTVNLPVVSLNW
jgi:hypothetical protein